MVYNINCVGNFNPFLKVCDCTVISALLGVSISDIKFKVIFKEIFWKVAQKVNMVLYLLGFIKFRNEQYHLS